MRFILFKDRIFLNFTVKYYKSIKMKRTLFVTAFLLLLFLGFWSLPGCKKNNPEPLTGKLYSLFIQGNRYNPTADDIEQGSCGN